MATKTTRLFSVMNEEQLKARGFEAVGCVWSKTIMSEKSDEGENDVSICVMREDGNGYFTNQVLLWIGSEPGMEVADFFRFDDVFEYLQDGLVRFITKDQLFTMQQRKYDELFRKWQAYAEEKKKTLNFWDPNSDREFSRIEYQMKLYKPCKEKAE